MTPLPSSRDDDAAPVCVRLRFSPDQVRRLERVRAFLGLPSISATAARLCMWNADEISNALTSLGTVLPRRPAAW